MIKVDSSFVREIGFEEGVLEVVLENGTYSFCNVPESLYKDFLNARSKGSFFNEELKDNINYRC